MSGRAGVVVVVPARDERQGIRTTLRTVHRSLEHARSLGLVGDAVIHVVAHRCLDDTARRASRFLRSRGCGLVTEEMTASTIGEVRDLGARLGLAALPTPALRTWVLSTDADTTVGIDWVSMILAEASRRQVVAVVGTARLDRWRGGATGKAAYDAVLASKLHGRSGDRQHDHVYGANLAVRADAYLDCGGFPHIPHGEDQQLVDRLEAAGHRLLRTRDIEVTTSGRLEGRARGGLAEFLRKLDGSVAEAGAGSR